MIGMVQFFMKHIFIVQSSKIRIYSTGNSFGKNWFSESQFQKHRCNNIGAASEAYGWKINMHSMLWQGTWCGFNPMWTSESVWSLCSSMGWREERLSSGQDQDIGDSSTWCLERFINMQVKTDMQLHMLPFKVQNKYDMSRSQIFLIWL